MSFTKDAVQGFAAKVRNSIDQDFQRDINLLQASLRREAADYQTMQKRYKERIEMALEAKVENLS